MSEEDDDFAVAARTRIEARNRERDRKAARRDRREQILLWLCAPLLLPAAGAAAATAVVEAKPSAEVPLFLAAFAVPAVLTIWLARRRGWFERVDLAARHRRRRARAAVLGRVRRARLRSRLMITGIHAIQFTQDADALRAFLRDTLELPSVDAGRGWLIFGLPPAELAAHPGDTPGTELYLMCDDIEATVAQLEAKGVELTSR